VGIEAGSKVEVKPIVKVLINNNIHPGVICSSLVSIGSKFYPICNSM
jgi:hypothetical protein